MTQPATIPHPDLRGRIAAGLDRARSRSMALTTGALDDRELTAQHSPIMSPLVWDLAHIGNQEELWLVRDAGGLEPVRCDIDSLYDAFKHPRRDRPALPLLDPTESRAYLDTVRSKVLDLLDQVPFEGRRLTADGFVFGMIVQHEQQHDETMLATHQLRRGQTVLVEEPLPAGPRADPATLPAEVLVPAGPFTMGTSVELWALDNERPAHEVHLPAFRIDTFPVSNADYLAFVEDGGYGDPRWWADEGWRHRTEAGLVAPQSWQRDGAHWWRNRFGTVEPVPGDEPVQHVCWYEADAYARWAGKRLPTEAEWEKAARHDPATGGSRRYPWGDGDPTPATANLGGAHLRPAPLGSYPGGASAYGVQQMLGDVWEWTASDFRGYPGFEAYPYREYSEAFFGPGCKVVRGGSWATDAAVCRCTFRNWDYPIRRQVFAGFRCARDAEPDEVT